MAIEDVGIRFLVIALGEFRRATGTVRDDISGVEKSIRTVSGAAADWGTTMTRVGSAVTSVGRSMTLAITTPLAIIVGSFINAGVQIEDAFAGVTKTVDGLAEPTGELTQAGYELRNQFVELSQTIPISPEQLSALGQLAGQFGETKDTVIDMVDTLAKLQATTDLVSEAQQQAFAQVARIVGLTADEYDNMASAVVFLGNNFPTTESRIMDFTQRIAGTGAALNISIADLLAWGAAVTASGIQAEAGATAWRKAIIDMTLASASGTEGIIDNTASIADAQDKVKKLSQDIAVATQRQNEFTYQTKESTKMANQFKLENMNAELEDQQALLEGLTELQGEMATGGSAKLQTYADTVTRAFQDSGMSVDAFAAKYGILPGLLDDGIFSAKEFADVFKKDASGAMQLFISGLAKMDAQEQIKTLDALGLSAQRVGSTIQNLAANEDLLYEALTGSTRAFDEGVALQEEFNKRVATTKNQIQLLKNDIAAMGLTVFSAVEEDIKAMIDGLRNFFDRLTKLDPKILRTIVIIASIAAAVGPLLIIFGSLISSVGTIVTLLGALASPAGIAALAIGGVVLALGSLIGWDNIINGIQTAFEDLQEPVAAAGELVGRLIEQKTSLQEIWDLLNGKEPAKTEPGPIAASVASKGQASVYATPGGTEQAPTDTKTLVDQLGIPPEVIQGIQSAVEWFNQLMGAVNVVGQAIGAFVDVIVGVVWPQIQSAFDSLTETMGSMGITWGDVWEAIKTAIVVVAYIIAGVIAVIIGVIAGLLSAIASFVKGAVETWQSLTGPISLVISGIQDYIVGLINFIKAIFSGDLNTAVAMAAQIFTGLLKIVAGIVSGIGIAFSGMVTTVFETIKGFVDGIVTFFTNLYDRLIGHSIVPDIVNGILGAFGSLKDTALEILGGLVQGATDLIASIFGGGDGKGFSFGIGPDQIAAIQTAITTIQEMFLTLFLTIGEQIGLFFANLVLSFSNLPVQAQIAFDLIVGAVNTLVASIVAQLTTLQETAVTVFTTMGTTAASAFASGVTESMSAMIGVMTGQMTYLDEYWLETVRHMVGHWLDFKAATEALTSDWVTNTIASFDTVHNQSVGKMHLIRDAWTKDTIPDMEKGNENLTNSMGAAIAAFGKLGGAAGAAAGAVWAAAHAMVAAMRWAAANMQGSPELKIQHPFEKFEQYMKATDFGSLVEAQMRMPAFMTQVNPVMPANAAAGGNTTINRNITTGDLVGTGLDSQDEVVDTMLRVVRTSEALSG